jgi:hypothetical protein
MIRSKTLLLTLYAFCVPLVIACGICKIQA